MTQSFVIFFSYFTLPSSISHRAIILAWFLIFTTAIPTAICHGEVDYVHKGENHTACLFLSENGYRHDLFQVVMELCFLHTHTTHNTHTTHKFEIVHYSSYLTKYDIFLSRTFLCCNIDTVWQKDNNSSAWMK